MMVTSGDVTADKESVKYEDVKVLKNEIVN